MTFGCISDQQRISLWYLFQEGKVDEKQEDQKDLEKLVGSLLIRDGECPSGKLIFIMLRQCDIFF